MKLATVALDWKAYFQHFCRAHGGDDLMPWGAELGKGILVFPDGWTYSATDYAGPEWPPPTSKRELRKLQVHYWQKRKDAARRAVFTIEGRINWLKAMQGAKSVALQQRVRYATDVVGADGMTRQVMSSKAESLNLDGLEEQLQWVRRELERCEEELQ